ncbi:molybdate ABC transporter substrate-binding protein [Congregibacter sp.]|uniref:molybdate ABC transporter substrate-binding protein n=1 Tax=Congregibacter sp. TaxID=2744308 RepID=UPI003F6C23D0
MSRIKLSRPRASLVLSALLAAGQAFAADVPSLNVAVAANFRVAAQSLGENFTAHTGVSVQISSASTGVLAAQMRRGAPFDVLLAADYARPQGLVDDGTSPDPAQCYAEGSLVLLGADAIGPALADASKSIAIANPRSAPYGTAALAVLARDGFASAAERRVVRGNNVQQALQFYLSGGADLALVARSLSPNSGTTIPRSWYPPIEQFAVLNAESENLKTARAFLDYLLSPEATPVLESFGYKQCS